MDLFISTYTLKIDDKGRVSVPSAYRSIIQNKAEKIYGYTSFNHQCIEVYTTKRLELIKGYIENLDLFSQARDTLSTAVLASSEELNMDAKGRIMLPEFFIDHANLKGEVLFAGKGQTFEIWNKENFLPYYEKARKDIKQNGFNKGE